MSAVRSDFRDQKTSPTLSIDVIENPEPFRDDSVDPAKKRVGYCWIISDIGYHDHQSELDAQIELSAREYERLRLESGETPFQKRIKAMGKRP